MYHAARAISSLLSACAVALALLGAPSQASAVPVTPVVQFGANPSPATVGDIVDLNLSITVIPDPLAVDTIVAGFADIYADFFGGAPAVNFSLGDTLHQVLTLPHVYNVAGDYTAVYMALVVVTSYYIDGGEPIDTFFNLDGGVPLRVNPAAAPVPLPAALPLFAGGLGGLGVMGWWRRRKAATC